MMPAVLSAFCLDTSGRYSVAARQDLMAAGAVGGGRSSVNRGDHMRLIYSRPTEASEGADASALEQGRSVMAHGGDDSDNTNNDNTSAEVWEVLRTLVLGHADHNRLLELYYWSQEPGLLEAVRGLL